MLSLKKILTAAGALALLTALLFQTLPAPAAAVSTESVTERLFEEYPLENVGYSYPSSGVSTPSTEYASVLYSHAFLTMPLTQLSKDLAKASVALAMAAYEPSSVNSLLSEMGFDYDDNSAVYQRSRNDLTLEKNDLIAYTIAYKEWTDPETDETYVFYCVPIQGTPANAEWFSDFNLGKGVEHEGFRNASLEVYNKLQEKFKTDNAEDNAHRRVWVTGHSRGAACANILAGWLSAESEAYTSESTVTAYTFACPAVSLEADDTLANIYNFNNDGDLITMVPMKSWGYKRYGRDISLDTSDSQYSNMQLQFNSTTGDTYAGEKSGAAYEVLITNILGDDRNVYYDSATLQLILDFAAWTLGGKNDVGIDEIAKKHLSGFSGMGNKLEILFEVGSGVTNLAQLAVFLNTDKAEKDLIAEHAYRAYSESSAMTEEEFQSYISTSDISALISDIKAETEMDVGSAYDFMLVYLVLDERNYDTARIMDCVKAAMDLVCDEDGSVMDKIGHAHCQALYTTWINSMYWGYRGWADNLSLESVTVESGVLSVGEQCFRNCISITDALMDHTVMQLGPQAFYNCTAIRELTVPVEYNFSDQIFYGITGIEKITYYKGSSGRMQDRTYYNYHDSVEYQSSLSTTQVVFEEGITHIGDYAFHSSSNGRALTSVSLPSTLKSIGSYSFAYSQSLGNISFPASLLTIGDHAFYECQSLSVNTLPESLTDIGDYSFYNCDGINIDILIHENIRRVGSHAFYDCDGIPKITVKSADTELSTYAFAECSTVKELLIPVDYDIANNPFNGISTVERITYSFGNSGKMRDKTYNNFYDFVEYFSRQSLDTVIFEEGITHIGDYAFCGQSDVENTLSTVILPSTLRTVGSYAFAYCKHLTEVTFGDSIRTVEDHAFYECQSLSVNTLPESLTDIGDYSFYNCDGIVIDILIHENIRRVGSYAFYDCDGLPKITVKSADTELS
ncbi:MAG: leucine-rich repeat protein, partial [Clostridia bacterium]|nr:leucine-rich repeat protein [Clostridia bacterium]